jgi:hypothetical protein
MPLLVSSKNTDVSLPLCYLSGALAGLCGVIAVLYNLRGTGRRPTATTSAATEETAR